MFEELQAACEKTPPREVKSKSWISDATELLIDNRSMSQKRGVTIQQGTRWMGRRIKALLNSERKKKAVNVASNIEGHLELGI